MPSSAPRIPVLQWKKSKPGNSKLSGVLSILQRILRSVYRRKVSWPADESYLAMLSAKEYLWYLLQPITNMYNELHAPGALPNPVECVHVDLGEFINGVTFVAPGNILWDNIPVVLSFPGPLFDRQGYPSPQTLLAVSKAIECDSDLKTIIVTDFKDIAVFQTPSYVQSEHIFTRIQVSTCQPALTLRVITMAYMEAMLIRGRFINTAKPVPEVEDEELFARGPPMNPDDPLVPDEEVFATNQRYSDFDEVTLVKDPARALQFFRWVNHVRQHCSKLVTKEFLQAIQRQSPLSTDRVADNLAGSKSFSIKIESVISEGERSICSVYRCRVVSIDGNDVSDSPSLCLKLFDDRFQPRECPETNVQEPGAVTNEKPNGVSLECEEPDEDVDAYRDYLASIMRADQLVMTEAAAYNKLRPVQQGSIVPWFYGVHTFVLPDGMHLYGLLMEYIEGTKLHSGSGVEVSADRQIALIKSCRHGARVLDTADIAQHDWHRGQILFYTNPTSKLDHGVFIDFAITSQTYSVDRSVLTRNYLKVLMVLLGDFGDVWLNPALVWDYYDGVYHRDVNRAKRDSYIRTRFVLFVQLYVQTDYLSHCEDTILGW
ncbi:hypothetical protein BDY19DRAFT_1046776 [Irpex rosettiformis]|uniref:Uncharacterized protein n=1 Tax=Irpex rosettiformis TaxID=378272 RepID=A0ACB8U9V8_9APHY|nr:hypothetical protein BDY19DRAFT_1046776 [Irpex rosettiformis]